MRVEVKYDVPVSAWVNVDTGEVEGVNVWCEGIEQRNDEYAIVTADREAPVSAEHRKRAQEVADAAIWPAWDLS